VQGGVTGVKLNHAKFFEISTPVCTTFYSVQCVFIVVMTLVSGFIRLVIGVPHH
jgi:hypothetical protein